MSRLARLSPRLHYWRQGLRVVRDFLRADLPPRYQVYAAPLRADLDRCERLFGGSASWFREVVAPRRAEFRWPLGRIYNGSLSSVDAELYYSVLRFLRPRRVIEVGSGHSALFALDALARNGRGELLAIDPQPRRPLPRGVEHFAGRVEEAPRAWFERLGAGDVLFIDSSHTTREAMFHVEELLPRLAPGVVVHHHDVCLPYDVVYGGDRTRYGEQEVLLDFYEANPERYEILCAAAWVRFRHAEILAELVPSYRWNPYRIPGSLWTRVRGA